MKPTKSLILFSFVTTPDKVTIGPLSYSVRPWPLNLKGVLNDNYVAMRKMCDVTVQRPVENVPAEATPQKIVPKIKLNAETVTTQTTSVGIKISYKGFLEISKIESKNQVPWREAKMTYAEIAITEQERPTTVENPEINVTTQIQKELNLLIRTMKIVLKLNVNEKLKMEEIKKSCKKTVPWNN